MCREFVAGRLNGTLVPYVEAGATVDIRQDGDVAAADGRVIDGVTRAVHHRRPHPVGGNYDRTPGPSDTPFGRVSASSTADDGAVYVTLAQNNSGDYTPLRLALRRPVPAGGDRRGEGAPTFTG